jgi:7,8-dihydroneopterin aldolase/epimerase/oxygenase
MSDRLVISGLTLHGYHGVYPEEKREGQTFVVDLELEWDARRAADTDDVTHTIDYSLVVPAVADIVTGEPVDLIETLARRIAERVLEFPLLDAVTVTVHKPQAPLPHPVADVAFSTRRERGEL